MRSATKPQVGPFWTMGTTGKLMIVQEPSIFCCNYRQRAALGWAGLAQCKMQKCKNLKPALRSDDEPQAASASCPPASHLMVMVRLGCAESVPRTADSDRLGT